MRKQSFVGLYRGVQVFFGVLFFLFGFLPVFAALPATIHSVAGVGQWNNSGSWVEGRVPSSQDIVEINGNIALNVSPTIQGLSINSGAQLSGGFSILVVNGLVENYGNLVVSVAKFYGDFLNRGTLSTTETRIYGTGMSLDSMNAMTGNLYVNADIFIPGGFRLNGSLVFNDTNNGTRRKITLGDNQILDIRGNIHYFGEIQGSNNTIDLYGDIYNLNLTGSSLRYFNIRSGGQIEGEILLNAEEVRIFSGVIFRNRIYYDGPWIGYTSHGGNIALSQGLRVDTGATIILENGNRTYGWSQLFVSGSIINFGKIGNETHPANKPAPLFVSGDIGNYGVWNIPTNIFSYGQNYNLLENKGVYSSPNTIISGGGLIVQALTPLTTHVSTNANILLTRPLRLNGNLEFNNTGSKIPKITLPNSHNLEVHGNIYNTAQIEAIASTIDLYGDMYNVNLTGDTLDQFNIRAGGYIEGDAYINAYKIRVFSGATVKNKIYYDGPWTSYVSKRGVLHASHSLFVDKNATIAFENGNTIHGVGELFVSGSIVNSGKVGYRTHSTTNPGRITVGGHIDNFGDWISPVSVFWASSPGATSYNLRFDPGTSTGVNVTNTTYDVTSLMPGRYYWQVKPNSTSAYGVRCINRGCVSGNGNNGTLFTNTPVFYTDLFYQAFPKTTIASLQLNISKNIDATVKSTDALDPVDLATGNFTYGNTFLRLPGNTLDYEFSLSYQSQAQYDGPAGYGWDHNWNKRLLPESDGSLTYYDGKLGKYTFVKTSTGFTDISALGGARIVETNTGNSIAFKNGDRAFFGTGGRIQSYQNQYGATLSFEYNDAGALTRVIDTLGRNIDYTYTNDGHLTSVVAPGGRTIGFEYFASGSLSGTTNDLSRVVMTNSGETRTIGFAYSLDYLNPSLNHNITQLIDSRGQVYVQNIYDTNDRVLSQKYGEKTGSYQYTLKDIHVDDTPTTEGTGQVIGNYVVQNRVTDRSGNVTEYFYNRSGNVTKRISGDREYTYVYDSLGRMTEEILPRGNGTKYTYDARGNTLEVRKKPSMQSADGTGDLVTTYVYTGSYDTLASMTDARGYTIQNTVDSFGRITSVRQPDMSETRFEYDASGHLQKSIDAAGIVTLYTYNPSGQLVEKKEALSQTEERTHSYISDIYGNILSETDGRGNTKISHYDAFDRLIEQTSPEGKKVSMSYDANGNQTTLSRVLDDGTTITTNFTYTLLDKVATVITPIDSTHARTTTYTYDGDDRLTMTQVGSGISIQRFEYNAFGEITKTQNGLTNPYVSLTTYDANGNKQTETLTGVTYTYTYDGFDRIQKITNPQGTERRFLYDANGNTIDESWYSATGMILGQTKNEYDTQNHITKTQVLLGTGGFATTEYGYDSRGNRTKMIDALGYITTYGYDTLGRQTRTTLPNGAQKTLVYDKNDNILSETELIVGKDFVTNHTYDRDNRRLSTTTPDNQTTTFAYNTLDQQTKVTSAKNRETNRTYDYEGRLLTESVGGKTTRYEYDLLGNPTTLTDAKNNSTIYEYNSDNRITRMSYPNQKSVDYTYDINGNIHTTKDPNGTITTYTYDALGRNTRKDYTLGSGVGGITWESYAYDALGRLIATTDSLSHDTTFLYDTVGNLVSETNANKTTTYTYDALGRRTSMTTPLGRTLTYIYDDIGRISEIREGSGVIVSYGYNPMSLLHTTLANGINTDREYDDANRLSKIGATSLSYDAHGNIISRGPDSYTYDTFDQVTEVHYGDARLGFLRTGDKYLYDLMGNRETGDTRIATGTGEANWQNIYNYQINNLNQYTNIAFAYTGSAKIEPLPPTSSGTTSTGGTNTGSTSSGTVDTCSTAPGSSCDIAPPDTDTGVIIIDPPPGPVYETESAPTGDTDVTDGEDIQMLIASAILPGEPGYPGETGSGTVSSGSTDTGSTSSGTLPPGVLPPDPPASTGGLTPPGAYTGTASTGTITLTSVFTGTLLYDDNGNLIGNTLDGQRIYELTYDAKNRLLSVARYTAPSTKVTLATYDYDALGRRITKSTGDTTITYIYSGDTAIEEYTTTANTLTTTREYTLTPNVEDDIVHMRLTPYSGGVATTSQDSYYEKDHLGSIIRITDKDQNIIDEYTYSLFGQPYRKDGTGMSTPLGQLDGSGTANISPITNTRLFTGREYDSEVGMYFNRARYYDPAMGRFLSPDPIGTADDINLYRYVVNSPVMYTDRNGKEKKFIMYFDRYLELDGIVSDVYFRFLHKNIQNTLLGEYRDVESKAKYIHYNRNLLNTGLPSSPEHAISEGWESMPWYQNAYHNHGSDTGNVKFISSTGKKEVIYNSLDNIVTSDENMGTYNFYDPRTNAAAHYEYDVKPYYIWGNSLNDTTGFLSRRLGSF